MTLAGLKNGTESLRGRMGADFMIVPIGYEKAAQEILLKGEPGYFYLDKSVEGKIREV